MTNRNQRQKKAYVAPRVVDFGAIEATTGDCLGLCLDGEHLLALRTLRTLVLPPLREPSVTTCVAAHSCTQSIRGTCGCL